MNRAQRVAIAAALAAAILRGSIDLAQTPARDARPAPPAPAPTGTAVAAGSVVSADNPSLPIRQAYVVLIGATTGTLKVTSTDANGQFTFAGLPADHYSIGASKPPYLGAVAGARRPAQPGVPVALADGQRVLNISIRMPMGAAISGTISDERGQPAANVSVVLRQWKMQNGERTLVPVGRGDSTDDRGRYRFFGLTPGEYAVIAVRFGPPVPAALTTNAVDDMLHAGRGTAPAGASVTTGATQMRPAPVAYPGTTRAGDAGTIAVATGEDRQGIDFRLELARTAKIEGVVTSDAGPLPPGCSITLANASSGLSVISRVLRNQLPADGRFSFDDQAPGTYTLSARGAGAAAGQFASTTIEISGVDLLGIQLALRPALVITGHLAFDGASPQPSVAGRRVAITGVPPAAGATPQTTPTTTNGSFTISNLEPGRYLIGGPLAFGPNADALAWTLESVVVDGRDVTDQPVDISAETPPKDVVITYGDRWQELSGKLSGPAGAPVADDVVVAFPADRAYWITGSRRIAVAHPGSDGHFVLSARGPATLPPGRYLLAAVTDINRDEQFDPAFLASLVPSAVPVTLQAGDAKVQDVIRK